MPTSSLRTLRACRCCSSPSSPSYCRTPPRRTLVLLGLIGLVVIAASLLSSWRSSAGSTSSALPSSIASSSLLLKRHADTVRRIAAWQRALVSLEPSLPDGSSSSRTGAMWSDCLSDRDWFRMVGRSLALSLNIVHRVVIGLSIHTRGVGEY